MKYFVIDPVILDLGIVQIYWYGVMYLLAFLAAYLLAKSRVKSYSEWNVRHVDDLIFYELNIIDLDTEEVIFNQDTNDLNFVVPVYILFEDPIEDEEMLFSWNVTATDDSEFEYSTECLEPFTFSLYYEGTSAIGDENIPEYYELSDAYPNPFNPITYIEYAVPESEFITLSVYDINGKLIEVLDSGNKLAGYYKVYWNATYVPSGTYFITFTSSKYSATRKISLIK